MDQKKSNSDSLDESSNQNDKFEYLEMKYNHILPSIQRVISEIPDKALRWKMEYLLNDYRRMWHRSHCLEMEPDDGLLSEVKVWTDAHSHHQVMTSPSEESKTESVTGDIDAQFEKLRDFQKKVAVIKDRFSKVSEEVMSQVSQEKEACGGFSLQAALNRIQEMPSERQVEADSVPELIKQIDTLKTLMDKQRLRLAHLFQEDSDVSERLNKARQTLSEADAFQNEQEIHRCGLEALKRDWLLCQENHFNELYSFAEPIVTQLKDHQCTELRQSIIASESITEYRRLLAAERKYSSTKAQREDLLLASQSIPGFQKHVASILSLLSDSREECEVLSKQVFERMSLEREELKATTPSASMGAPVDTEVEPDFVKLRTKSSKRKNSYHSSISSLFDIISRAFSEYRRLLKVQRLRDLQMTSLVHNIDKVSLVVASHVAHIKTPEKTPLKANAATLRSQNAKFWKGLQLSKMTPKSKVHNNNNVMKEAGKKCSLWSKEIQGLPITHVSGRAIKHSREICSHVAANNSREKQMKKKKKKMTKYSSQQKTDGLDAQANDTLTTKNEKDEDIQRSNSFCHQTMSINHLLTPDDTDDFISMKRNHERDSEAFVSPWSSTLVRVP